MTYLDLVKGQNLYDLSSCQVLSILPSDRCQLTNHRSRQRMVGGALAVERAHCFLHGLLGIGIVLTYIPKQIEKSF